MDPDNETIEATEENYQITKDAVSNAQIINDTEDDIEYSRDKMKSLIDQSCEAINQMMALASESLQRKALQIILFLWGLRLICRNFLKRRMKIN